MCGTAIESPCAVAAQLRRGQGRRISPSRASTTPGPVARHFDVKGYLGTTGIGPRPHRVCARLRSCGMVDEMLSGRYGDEPAVEAYMLCSVCADLRISEVVDHAQLGGVVIFSQAAFE